MLLGVPETKDSSPERPFTVGGNRQRLLALAFWLALICGYQLYAWGDGPSPLETGRHLLHLPAAGPGVVFGVLVYLVLWAARPLVLFPAGLLAAATGLAFGPAAGVVLTLVGGNASASVAYLLGRYFGNGLPEAAGRRTGLARRCAERLRGNSFEAVLALQLVYMPFDLVNCTAGLLRVRWRRFALATLLGTLPGTVSFVLLGASLGPGHTGPLPFDPRMLSAAAGVFLVSLLAYRYTKRRERQRTHNLKGDER